MSTRSTTSRALLIAGVCVLSLVVCSGLAWWQWDQYNSAGGSFQNLGYVLQWPLFGLFPMFMVWRMYILRKKESQAQGSVVAGPAPERARTTRPAVSPARRAPTPVADHAEPEDEELAAYNAYLAELNARDKEGT